MNALVLVFTALLLFAIAYRFYGLFLANKVLGLDAGRATPAVVVADGHDYHKTNKYVLFGHHFAAIAAAGPLLGPVLAAQFGYLPGALWILIGAVVAGAVHDMVVLFASVRHEGHSLSMIAESEVGKAAGTVASFAFLFILILTLAGLSIAVVNAMFESVWGTFTVFSTMPIALFMGLWMYKIRPGDIKGASIIGVTLLFLGDPGGALRGSSSGCGRDLHAVQEADLADHPGLRLSGFFPARLAAALPARLSFDVSQAGNDYPAGGRHLFRAATPADAGTYALRPRRRPGDSRRGLPVRIHHDRLRRPFRFPCHYRHGNDAEDGRQ